MFTGLMRLFWGLTSWAVILSIAVSCKPKASSAESEVQGNISEGRDYLWPEAQASVCWEFDIPQKRLDAYAPMRQKIQNFVTQEMARAGFKLTGWGKCESGSRGMRVAQWTDGEPNPDNDRGNSSGVVKAFGRRLDGLYRGIGMHMDVKNSENCPSEEVCVLVTALHEFGHAVGLRHEMNRKDSPCFLDQTGGFGEDAMGSLPQGQFDRDSIMNYCRNLVGQWTGEPLRLSPGDIAAIKALYAQKPVFPREEACRKDGHSWVADAMSSCCRVGANTRLSSPPSYPICPDLSPASQSSPGTPPAVEINSGRLIATAKLSVTVTPPLDVGLFKLVCHEGEYLYKDSNQPKGTVTVSFLLGRATTGGRNTFTCTHIDAYERNGENIVLQSAKKMARMTFSKPMTLEASEKPVNLDLRSASWQIFPVVNGVPSAPAVPVAKEDQPIDPLTKAPIEASAQKKVLVISIENVSLNAYIRSGILDCDVGPLTAASQVTQTHKTQSQRSFQLIFLLPMGSDKTKINCTKFSWTADHTLAPNQTTRKANTVTFQEPLSVVMGPDVVKKNFTAPACADVASTNPEPPQNRQAKAPAGQIPQGDKNRPTPKPATTSPARPPVATGKGPSASDCNYEDAAKHNGWGWNPVTKTSCPPQVK